MLACTECAFEAGGTDQLKGHFSVEHMQWIRFECHICPMVYMPTEKAVRDHFRLAHPDSSPVALYRSFNQSNFAKLKAFVTKALLSEKMCAPETTTAKDPTDTTLAYVTAATPTADVAAMDSARSAPDPISKQHAEMPMTDASVASSSTVCALCGMVLEGCSDGTKEQHIWGFHMPVAGRYQCLRCQFNTVSTDDRVLTMHRRKHRYAKKGKSDIFKDNLTEYPEEFRQKWTQAFDSHSQMETVAQDTNETIEAPAEATIMRRLSNTPAKLCFDINPATGLPFKFLNDRDTPDTPAPEQSVLDEQPTATTLSTNQIEMKPAIERSMLATTTNMMTATTASLSCSTVDKTALQSDGRINAATTMKPFATTSDDRTTNTSRVLPPVTMCSVATETEAAETAVQTETTQIAPPAAAMSTSMAFSEYHFYSVNPQEPPAVVQPTSECRLCTTLLDDTEVVKTEHMWTMHMSAPMLLCALCDDFVTNSTSYSSKANHSLWNHPGLPAQFHDNRLLLQAEFESKWIDAFVGRTSDAVEEQHPEMQTEPPAAKAELAEEGRTLRSEFSSPPKKLQAKTKSAVGVIVNRRAATVRLIKRKATTQVDLNTAIAPKTRLTRKQQPQKVPPPAVDPPAAVEPPPVTPVAPPTVTPVAPPQQKGVQCKVCGWGRELQSKEKLLSLAHGHLWVKHMSHRRFNCSVCKAECNSYSRLTDHFVKQHPGMNIACVDNTLTCREEVVKQWQLAFDDLPLPSLLRKGEKAAASKLAKEATEKAETKKQTAAANSTKTATVTTVNPPPPIPNLELQTRRPSIPFAVPLSPIGKEPMDARDTGRRTSTGSVFGLPNMGTSSTETTTDTDIATFDNVSNNQLNSTTLYAPLVAAAQIETEPPPFSSDPSMVSAKRAATAGVKRPAVVDAAVRVNYRRLMNLASSDGGEGCRPASSQELERVSFSNRGSTTASPATPRSTLDVRSSTHASFSTQQPKGKLLNRCNLCKQGTLTTLRDKQYHIWMHHMPHPLAECGHCSYKTYDSIRLMDFARHNAKEHPDKAMTVFDNRTKLWSEFEEKWERAFRESSPNNYRIVLIQNNKQTNNATSKQEPLVTPPVAKPVNEPMETITLEDESDPNKCRSCGTKVETLAAQKEHVWLKHMGRPQVECSLCHWELPINDFRARVEHMAERHPGEEAAFIDYRADFDRDFRDKMLESFGKELSPPEDNSAKKASTKTQQASHLKCALCSTRVKNTRKSLKRHLWATHMTKPQAECRRCGWRLKVSLPHERADHTVATHPGMQPDFIDNGPACAAEITTKARLAFATQI